MLEGFERIRVVDSHTGGEPTRVVVDGGPDLGAGPLSERRALFADRFDTFRSAVVNEPRGSDVMVGALLVPPTDPRCVAGVIFFNNVGCLGMCGHGMIGVAVTLGHLGRISAGTHAIETPVGVVTIDYDGRNAATIENVPAFRHTKAFALDVPEYGTVIGDVAWGGNWFFLVGEHRERIALDNVARLAEVAGWIRKALDVRHVTGKDGRAIDHVELFGPPEDFRNHSRNFVLCPGGAYDRSPCGTGTSAKLACLHADGTISSGDVWRQESILGSVFEGSIRVRDGVVVPSIRGAAHVIAEATLLLDPADPFREGIRS